MATVVQLFNFISSFFLHLFGALRLLCISHSSHTLFICICFPMFFSFFFSSFFVFVFFSLCFTALLLHLTGILYAFRICISQLRSAQAPPRTAPSLLANSFPVNYAAVYAHFLVDFHALLHNNLFKQK